MKIKVLILGIILTLLSHAKGVEDKHQKWLRVSKNNCLNSGGKLVKNNICEASWEKAIKICSRSGGKLPSLQKLKQAVTSCGGEIEYFGNSYCKAYQSSYKKKGFNDAIYWSATQNEKLSQFAWVIYFYNGTTSYYSKERNYHVACVK